MYKKIIIVFLMLSFLITLSGCDNNETKEESKYNEQKIRVNDIALKEGMFLYANIFDFGESEELKNTNYKLVLTAETSNPFIYTVKCNNFNEQTKYCSESEETLIINDKEILIDNNEYSLDNRSKTEEKFLTYIQIINDFYLMIITDSDKYNENGNLIIYDFSGNKMFEETKIASNYYIAPTETNSEVHMDNLIPTVLDKTLVYYTCNKENEKVFKYNLSLETFETTVIEVIDAKCHIDHFN